MQTIERISRKVGLPQSDLEKYGRYMAKILRSPKKTQGTLVLVTAMTPTPQGEGKTTTAIGLCDGINRMGKRAIVTLRQPSLGVTFGLKGGATGGGKATVEPAEEINLHFTGDMYAVTEAHDLLSAMLDNHVYQGNKLGIDKRAIIWPRALDMEDRALRHIMIGKEEIRHESGFIITAASEVMSVLSLAKDEKELRERLGKIIVAHTKKGKPVTARQLKADGAMALLLRKAFLPNLVQTREGNAALIHGGAFANVSIGTNSVTATQAALHLAGKDGFVITETGFGSDLGLEKFMDIVAREGKLQPRVAVIVATVKAVERNGLENLCKHVENVQQFGLIPIVAINRFRGDRKDQIEGIRKGCRARRIAVAVNECFARGGKGAKTLAQEVVKASRKKTKMKFVYSLNDPLKTKIEKVARKMYGAKDVSYSTQAKRKIKRLKRTALPICIAKTQLSLSDDKTLRGRPTHFTAQVKDVQLLAGAGFVLVKMGNVLLMPGLPPHPAAERMG